MPKTTLVRKNNADFQIHNYAKSKPDAVSPNVTSVKSFLKNSFHAATDGIMSSRQDRKSCSACPAKQFCVVESSLDVLDWVAILVGNGLRVTLQSRILVHWEDFDAWENFLELA